MSLNYDIESWMIMVESTNFKSFASFDTHIRQQQKQNN